MTQVRFKQISSCCNDRGRFLFGLDENHAVFEYDFEASVWRVLPSVIANPARKERELTTGGVINRVRL